MDELRYPIGMQTFSEIIEEGYVYVDKTAYIKPLLRHGKYIFLSRPRRFGKSLLLSTLGAYFEGRRELFRGLAADRMDLDWSPSPVLRFDFNAENFSVENGLEVLLNRLLKKYERKYGMSDVADTVAGRFSDLIERVVESTGYKVVILIDEYDKPLLEIEDNGELFEKNQRTLKSFFGNLKSMDHYIRFAFITGVARFSKVSIFSDLNNLKDISMAMTMRTYEDGRNESSSIISVLAYRHLPRNVGRTLTQLSRLFGSIMMDIFSRMKAQDSIIHLACLMPLT